MTLQENKENFIRQLQKEIQEHVYNIEALETHISGACHSIESLSAGLNNHSINKNCEERGTRLQWIEEAITQAKFAKEDIAKHQKEIDRKKQIIGSLEKIETIDDLFRYVFTKEK